MKMETTYFLGMILFLLTTIIFVSKYRNSLDDLKISLIKQHKLLDDLIESEKNKLHIQNRLANYTLTAIELNNICDEFKSSREAKAKNEALQNLLDQLN